MQRSGAEPSTTPQTQPSPPLQPGVSNEHRGKLCVSEANSSTTAHAAADEWLQRPQGCHAATTHAAGRSRAVHNAANQTLGTQICGFQHAASKWAQERTATSLRTRNACFARTILHGAAFGATGRPTRVDRGSSSRAARGDTTSRFLNSLLLSRAQSSARAPRACRDRIFFQKTLWTARFSYRFKKISILSRRYPRSIINTTVLTPKLSKPITRYEPRK